MRILGVFTVLIIFVSSFLSFAAESALQSEETTAVEGRASNLDGSLASEKSPQIDSVAKSELEIPVVLETQKKSAEAQQSVFKFTIAIGILGVIGCAGYFLIRKYKFHNPQAAKTQIKILTQHYLGPKKSLAIIRVAGESMLIGITDNNINLIKSLALLDEDIPEESSKDLPKKFESVFSKEMSSARFQDDPQDDFTISGIREIVSRKIKEHEEPIVRKYCFLFAMIFFALPALAQVTLPSVNLGFKTTDNPQEIVNVIKVVLVMTVLTLAPAILIMMTSFTRIIIVLSILRQAMGVQQMPPNQLLVGLALFVTLFVMGPSFSEMNEKGIQPFMAGKINQEVAFTETLAPLRKFMFTQTRPQDLALFVKLAKIEKPKNLSEVPTIALIPAFIVSELKTAFQIGFIIFLPFLIIDMVAASVLMAMGMMMLPPVVISMPFKIMLFVLVDGWALLIGSMVKSFG